MSAVEKVKEAWKRTHLASKSIRDKLSDETLAWAMNTKCCITKILADAKGGEGCCHADSSTKVVDAKAHTFEMYCTRCDLHVLAKMWDSPICVICGGAAGNDCDLCDDQEFFEWRMTQYGRFGN